MLARNATVRAHAAAALTALALCSAAQAAPDDYTDPSAQPYGYGAQYSHRPDSHYGWRDGGYRAVPCSNCGVVESVALLRPPQVPGYGYPHYPQPPVERERGPGMGAVLGGVIGAALGHQIGGGSGRQAATVLGAIGGGLIGHQIERRNDDRDLHAALYEVRVRMADGSLRVLRQTQPLQVGQPVQTDGRSAWPARDQRYG